MTGTLIELLLVEDNASDMELTVRALQKHHFGDHLQWVKDGAEALDFVFARGPYLDRIAAVPPKMILLDLKLPKVSGMEVLREIRANQRTHSWPIVIFTSSKQERDVRDAYQLGVNSYVVKPVDFDEYSATLGVIAQYWLTTNQQASL